MKNINLSETIGDSCANSFILAFRSMFCTELIPEKNQAGKLISRYLKDYEQEISAFFEKNVLEDYCFVTDSLLKKREMIDDELKKMVQCCEKSDEDEIERFIEAKRSLEFTRLFNTGLYNLGMLLALIDESAEIDGKIIDAISACKYSEGYLFLNKKMNMLSTIHLGISSYIIENSQMNEQFSWNKHYDAAPNMQHIIRNQRANQRGKDYLVQNNPGILSKGDFFLSDILLLLDLYRVQQQCTLEKFMISLLFIAMSPEYEEWMQQYAYTIINILNEVMFCGEIHRLYLQEGYYNIWSDSEKTSKDATTRMSIIFSANNDDFYILRVDLPHKGEKTFHINMEEVVGETILPTGYPMTYEEFHKRNPGCNEKIFSNLFYELNNQIWFRSRFEARLKHESISAGLRDEIKELFHQQAHIAITTKIQGTDKCENQIAFVDEVRKYLKRMSMPESYFLSFGKGDIVYSEEIKKLRDLFQMEEDIIKFIFDEDDCRVMAKEILSLLNRYMDSEVDLEDFSEVSTLAEVWELIRMVV